MQVAAMMESLDQYGGDGVRKRQTSRLWYRQVESGAGDEISRSQTYQERSTSLLAPEVVSTVEWSEPGERSARA
jgi:hypothetical protein